GENKGASAKAKGAQWRAGRQAARLPSPRLGVPDCMRRSPALSARAGSTRLHPRANEHSSVRFPTPILFGRKRTHHGSAAMLFFEDALYPKTSSLWSDRKIRAMVEDLLTIRREA